MGSLPRYAYGWFGPALSCQAPVGSWKNASSRDTAAALPPIASNSARTLNGTIQWYCAPLPSTYGPLLPGLNDGHDPSVLRGWMYRFAGLNRFRQFCARAMNRWYVAVSPSRRASAAMPKSAESYSRCVEVGPQIPDAPAGRYPRY